jgi:hypothetical protein
VKRDRQALRAPDEGDFALLPLYARAIATQIEKYADTYGRIFIGTVDPVTAIARLGGATTGDRRVLRKDVPFLIERGVLGVADGYIYLLRFDPARVTWSRAAYPHVYERDDYACRYCGSVDDSLSVDHVVPRCQGGGDGADNLVLACKPCNSRKGGRTPEQAGMVLRPAPWGAP